MRARQTDIDALMNEAEAGGPGAALAAKRAAWLMEPHDPARARRALALAAKIAPLDPAPRLELARLAAEAGDLDAARREAQALVEKAVDEAARARAAFMLGEIARATGALGEARAHFTQTAAIEEALLRSDLSNPHAARWFARARGRLAEIEAAEGDLAKARTGAEGALAMVKAVAAQLSETPALAADIGDGEMRLGAIELDLGDAGSARRRFAAAISRYEALVLHEPSEPHWRAMLADTWALLAEAHYVGGGAKDARAAMDKALAIRMKLAQGDMSEGWSLAGFLRVRAALLAALGDAAAAAESLLQARLTAEKLCTAAPEAEAPARFLVQTLRDQTDHALRSGALGVAQEAADTARKIAESFALTTPESALWRSELAASWDRLGEIARAARAPSQDAFARAAEFRRMAHDLAPQDLQHGRALAAALIKEGDAALEARAPHTAYAAFGESVRARLELAEAAPEDPNAAYALAIALERLGLAAAAEGDAAGARAAWESELELAERFFEDESSNEAQRFFATVEAHLAGLNGADANELRNLALRRLDMLAHAGALTERDTALRKKLWAF